MGESESERIRAVYTQAQAIPEKTVIQLADPAAANIDPAAAS